MSSKFTLAQTRLTSHLLPPVFIVLVHDTPVIPPRNHRIINSFLSLPAPIVYEESCWGAWAAQQVKCPTVEFSSGHDLLVVRSSPKSGSALNMEPSYDSPPLSLPSPPHACTCVCACSLSPSKKKFCWLCPCFLTISSLYFHCLQDLIMHTWASITV